MREMDVFVRVVALAMILLAPLTAADREEVPVVREFHEAMTNRDHGQSLQNFISLPMFSDFLTIHLTTSPKLWQY